MTYFVYLLQCSDGSYYCGYTTDLKQRIIDHNESNKGAKYTRSHRPVTLVYTKRFRSLSKALQMEHAIKKLSHLEKSILAGIDKVV